MGERSFAAYGWIAAGIDWRHWGAAAFEEARSEDRLIFLNLAALWCGQCHEMDADTLSDDRVVELVNERFVPLRVETDRYPHVQDRYIAGGWPTTAFLTPTGEVLWAGTFLGRADFLEVARAALKAWETRREALAHEMEQRRHARHASRSRRSMTGLVRREAADDVLTAARQQFDARNGGFGDAPKFPNAEAVELLFIQAERTGDPGLRAMAEQSLDGILAGELEDTGDGGFFRYALKADWTEPRHEKLLEVNADMLAAFSLGAAVTGREDWTTAAERTVDWVESTLVRPDTLWGGSQIADEAYFGAAAADRAALDPPGIDRTAYTSTNAAWIGALATAGAHLARNDWVDRAAEAYPLLLALMEGPDGFLYHFAEEDEPAVPGLLLDVVQAACAGIALAEATGDMAFVEEVRALADAMEAALWSEDGGFLDHRADPNPVGALRYRERPFHWNAVAARMLTHLAWITGERGYRALAEQTLALLSPLAGRYQLDAAVFALAVEEFFQSPLHVVILGDGDDASDLRRAALAAPGADRRVWSLPEGGAIDGMRFEADGATAVVCGAHRRIADSADALLRLLREGP